MAHRRRDSGFPEKALPSRLLPEEPHIQDLQCHRYAKVHVDRLKCDTHRAMAKFLERAVRTRGNFVVAEPSWRSFLDRCRCGF